ncbi:MAG: chromate transporter [Nitrospirota bacterium]
MDKITIRDIFWKFLKIGSFSFGGVYSMLAFFERELVEKKKWLTHEEFVESVAIGQMTPGPPIVNTGICIGYKLRKLKGALATTVGQSFTGILLAILLAVFYVKSKGNVLLVSIMKGVGAAVVGLLLSIIFKMTKTTIKNYKTGLFALTAFFALAVFKLNPIALILASGVVGLIVYGRRA